MGKITRVLAQNSSTVGNVDFCLSFSDRVLQANKGLEFGLGTMQWELAGTLAIGWTIVYCIIRNVAIAI